MPLQYFALDSNHAGFAAAMAALATLNAANFSYTPILVQRACPHDSTIKIVAANITESEINADADLVDCRQNAESNFLGTELCRHRWYDADDFRVRGFHLLEESVRSTIGVAGQEYYCVKPRVRPASGTGTAGVWIGYGEKTGKTLYDAADGTNDQSIFTAGTWPAGEALVDICGPNIRSRIFVATANNTADANDFLPMPVGDFSASPLTIRMDNRCYPGAVCAGIQDNDFDGSAGGRVWTQDGTNPNMWSRITANTDNDDHVLYVDPTMSESDITTKGYLTEAADVADCRTTDWSFFKDTGTNTLYVNIADGNNPRWRIGGSGLTGGWDVSGKMNDATTRSKGIRFIHCTFIECGNLAAEKTGEYEFRGCRFLVGTTYRPANGVGPTTYVGWSEDGVVPWDTADCPDPDTDEYIQAAVTAGSSLATWLAKITRFSVFYGTTAGVYESGPGFTDKGGFTVQGIRGEYVGETPSWAAARNLGSSFFDNVDGHDIGLQGQSGMSISFMYCKRLDATQSGNIGELFPINDSVGGGPNLSVQNMQNNELTDLVFIGGALGFSGAGVYARRNGTGLLTGNAVRRSCFAENPITAANDVFNGVEAGSYGIFSTWSERIEIDSVYFLRVGNPLGGENNADMCNDTNEGTNPLRGLLCGSSFDYHDCIFEDWGTEPTYDGRILMQRQLNWHQALKTIVSVTNGSPCRVEVTAHGFPDFTTPAAGINGHPEVYFDNMVGMTELQDQVYFAVWVDANHFDLYSAMDSNGDPLTPVDSSAFGSFVSGGCARGQIGGNKGVDNTFIKAGVASSNNLYKYAADGFVSLDDLQTTIAASQQHLPGCADVAYETNPTLIAA